MSWTIGVDVGATFTDFYVTNDEAVIKYVDRTSSTPANPTEGILTGPVIDF